ncbi:hypothetical protein EDWATA_02042 [Edwardsiella tarda ATCC 23685]|uniref:Uncharacterized protein n=1 Tax=Edwardsiella tarda ATCC 23685 TaxID=500638 RepID=D4F5L4_EDWTA|nr:hypothetical protein EDWATA_02042 [Edwardsiella tarda ATCC 23685]
MLDCLDVCPAIQHTFPHLFNSLLSNFLPPIPNKDGEVNRYCISAFPFFNYSIESQLV